MYNIDVEPVQSQDQKECCGDCEECEIFNLRCVNSDPIILPVIVDKCITLEMELDSGSSTNVISENLYKMHFSHITLNKSKVKMCLYNGHKITP